MNLPQIDHPVYIDNNDMLAQCCQQWSSLGVVALDTEFIRTDTFYPIGALIQVSDGEQCFLIDPLSIDQFQPFIDILINESIVKVLHACGEDLEVFERLFSILPKPVFDTQIAAAMDGYGFSLGYQRLTEVILNIHVPKGETRSNWLQRPLSDSQIHYAAVDVAYLHELYECLHKSLQQKGRLEWLQEECIELIDSYFTNRDIDNYYVKVKSAWKLNSRELATLQQLIAWRENLAREKDKPRGRILKDRSCFEISRLQPATIDALARIEDVSFKIAKQYGEKIFSIYEKVAMLTEDELPQRLPPPLSPQLRTMMKLLKACTRKQANELSVAEEMLVKKRDYEALVRSGLKGEYRLPGSLLGWRQPIIGDALLAIAKQSN